ncbi:hypothetical protein [Dermatobacter hominis]|uniref:hypothetical protein n=1 Tax=Dermatobacter hominis TaxID=2884263 RepID=UPI001D0FCB3A|nr:hypothetical protein [Dermatobacter hominis]UDY35840.1 hypothetical protein LH044_21295 [Dermatobacter hominis]
MARFVLVAALVAMCAGAGCTHDGDRPLPPPATLTELPIGEGAVPAGAALPDWFTVPEGAVLVGGPFTVFPPEPDGMATRPDLPEDRSWEAILAVTGNPLDVMKELQQQASALGLVFQPAGFSNDPVSTATFCRDERDGDHGTYVCRALAAPWDARTISFSNPIPPDQLRAMTIVITQQSGDRDRPSESTATLTYRDDGVAAWGVVDAFGDPAAALGAGPGPPPQPWVPLPKIGSPFGTGGDFLLERGSDLTIPTLPACEGLGLDAVLAVDTQTSDPQVVLDRYVDQALAITPSGEAGRTTARRSIGDVTWVSVSEHGAGDDGYVFAMTQTADGRSSLRITGCGSPPDEPGPTTTASAG